MRTSRSLAASISHRCLPWTVTLALAVTATAQTLVTYGEPARRGTITAANQTHRYLLAGAQQGDTLRIAFASQNSGCCSYYYYHQIDVWQGTTHIGGVQGYGALTVALPSSGYYTLEVRARDNQSTGWYAFALDRLNDPVTAERIAFNWNMGGSITTTAGFAVYTLRASAGGSAVLRFTCQNSGCCSYYYYHFAQIVDSAGNQVATVAGNGSTPVTFPTDGVYTLFVAARDYQSTGWYAVSVDCQSWPLTPCDTVAHSSNYGSGSSGTNGVPTLIASTLPQLGGTLTVDVGNSYGQQTAAFLLIGPGAANVPLPAYGGTLLVAYPSVTLVALPPNGQAVNFALPNDQILLGIGIAMQSIVADPGVAPGVAFSRGLLVVLGQ